MADASADPDCEDDPTGDHDGCSVLHVCMPTVAGVPTVVLGYIADQLAHGWSVTLACPTTSGWLAERATQAGAHVVNWPATRAPGWRTVGEVRHLAHLVDGLAPDIVHLHSAKAGLAGRLAIRGHRPTVFQPHAWSFLAATGVLSTASAAWERRAMRWTDALVCVSSAEQTGGQLRGVVGPTWVVANTVDCSALLPASQAERARVRQRLGLSAGPLVVCVGRLCPQKGQQDLLGAWDHVLRTIPTARLILVGDGPDRAELEARLTATANVTLVGERPDVPAWLAAADVVAVPSRWEGMALVPLEALALARSVVGTAVAGMSESIPDSAGAIVGVGDARAMARAIVVRLLDPAGTDIEGRAGRAHVEHRHDTKIAADALAGVYSHVLSAGSPARRRSHQKRSALRELAARRSFK